MTLLDEMCSRLMTTARANGWDASEERALISRRFRGRTHDADAQLPQHARGLILGRYPVLATEISLHSPAELTNQLRAAHNQMIIARSLLRPQQIIDAHILFVAAVSEPDTDWQQQVDLIERDEKVCRKLVWVPDPNDLERNFRRFADRTFLARPWYAFEEHSDAPLDQNERLIQRVLQDHGLSAEAADAWVELAQSGIDDHDELVERLVSVMKAGR